MTTVVATGDTEETEVCILIVEDLDVVLEMAFTAFDQFQRVFGFHTNERLLSFLLVFVNNFTLRHFCVCLNGVS